MLLLALWIKTSLLNMMYRVCPSLPLTHSFSPPPRRHPLPWLRGLQPILSTILLPFSGYVHMLVLCAWNIFLPLLKRKSYLCLALNPIACNVTNPFPFLGLKSQVSIWFSSPFLLYISSVILSLVDLSALSSGVFGREAGVPWE